MATTQLVSRAKSKQLRVLGVTANYSSAYVPPGHMISYIVVYNTTANAVTGGLNIGTADDGQEVLATLTVGASALLTVADTAILDRLFSMTGTDDPQQLFIHAETDWNSASLDIIIGLEKIRP